MVVVVVAVFVLSAAKIMNEQTLLLYNFILMIHDDGE